jgi:CRISPR-associated endonuclease/helicase Cas3
MMTFDEFFKKATQCDRYPFQLRFATNPELPAVVDVPTGLGKTAAVILGWLWRKRFASDIIQTATPRRLVYCLPMRVLVEQTAENAREWLRKLKNAGILDNDVHVYVLMGGEDEEDWDLHPEHEAILVGTQDMLLSRAINRGYAASRSRWPMHFGLLNTDCLWIFDEIQLMGAGLATTAQIEAFRRLLPFTDPPQVKASNGCRSVWMSATMQRDWLKTVDFAPRVDGLPSLELNGKDHAHDQVKKRWEAKKPLVKAKATMGEAAKRQEGVRAVRSIEHRRR